MSALDPNREGGEARPEPVAAGAGPDQDGQRRHRAVMLATLLRAGGHAVSGAALAEELGISRTAVWKHLQALRRRGLPITARPHRGYALPREALMEAAAQRFFPELLEAQRLGARLGHTVHWYAEVTSTNDLARRLAEEGAREGTVVVADRQTAGRGRLRRPWWSPHGGLWMSLLLRPRLLPAQLPVLALLTSVAVAEGIEEACGLPVTVKWPNDVELDGRKVAGILLEMVAEPDGTEYVVVGIGVNLGMPPGPIPEELRGRAAWLARDGVPRTTRNQLAACILQRLEELQDRLYREGSPPVLARWRRRASILGRPVRVTVPDGELVGTAVDIDHDGALLVETPDGARQRVLAGDVRRLRPADTPAQPPTPATGAGPARAQPFRQS